MTTHINTELPAFSIKENWEQLAEYWSTEVNRLEALKALDDYRLRQQNVTDYLIREWPLL